MSTTRKPKQPLTGNVQAEPTALVCEDVLFEGNVFVGAGTVIHPGAKILARVGGIRIGADCVIEEGVVIENNSPIEMIIGDENLFEVGCWIESPQIGNLNTFSMRSHVSSSIIITHHCSLGVLTTLTSSLPQLETLPPYTIIYPPNSERRMWDGSGELQERAGRAKMGEYLREVLPKFNRIRPNVGATPDAVVTGSAMEGKK